MAIPKIDGYRFGEIIIDGRTYRRDVIIYPEKVTSGWWRIDGHSLAKEDLENVLARPPGVLVVGQGTEGRMRIPEDTRDVLKASGIELKAMLTEQAVKTYNLLRESGDVVAALHLTC